MEAVTVELPEELVDSMDGLAEEADTTRNRVARELLGEWLARQGSQGF